ncbi:50S ribosomal protein L3 N(5)-glutamine methyltransferase [uncultured Paraglaciecola sp.]|uniref:50S ribosomal protein L3 N(5)-glutamine methyltransferase n=1 Tax=uncultured Paraglaciecola sp. TaxID=1765024 RepID=UPI0025FB8541|nr:50S ribosomal protein L3 N(5)-glutamine methyltransferase [uncultured Paraglaciecola sp.]
MIERREALLSELISVRDYIRWGASRFGEAGLFMGHGTDNAWDEAVQLVLFALHLPQDSGREVLDGRLSLCERKAVIDVLSRRISERIPAAYITNEAWFCGQPYFVDERVLVPRSPIAELIDNEFEPWLAQEPARILDLCTGSGCIGIASGMIFPEANIDLVDLSEEALEVAAINIKKHGVEDRVHLIQSDLFQNVSKKYQLIVSNPPYVDAKDISEMPEEFHQEPKMGLAAGIDGLDIVHRILKDARQYMTDDGLLIVETGNSCDALDDAYPEIPFTWIEFEFGGHGVFIISAAELDQYQGFFKG